MPDAPRRHRLRSLESRFPLPLPLVVRRGTRSCVLCSDWLRWDVGACLRGVGCHLPRPDWPWVKGLVAWLTLPRTVGSFLGRRTETQALGLRGTADRVEADRREREGRGLAPGTPCALLGADADGELTRSHVEKKLERIPSGLTEYLDEDKICGERL
uniref:transcription termination factor 2, mitochondrial isoform X2 n=1 Tax=Macaca mulatta TaxID=9544 RepID=UPI0010A27179|nr:transcription termination factor 2, mitochondrial isoform X2 [Macaca mulatta]XP_028684698.1 transcription termination factor 2, mitochondrial isoform X2 [Macaca mulatta]